MCINLHFVIMAVCVYVTVLLLMLLLRMYGMRFETSCRRFHISSSDFSRMVFFISIVKKKFVHFFNSFFFLVGRCERDCERERA